MRASIEGIQDKVAAVRDDMLRFFREIVAIPSIDGQIGEVGERVAEEMRSVGFDEVRFDKMGNILGRIGSGEKNIVYDSHIDTVGVGSPESWQWDPFKGKIKNGVLYARGACDEKGSTPGMVYGLSICRDLGGLEGWTAWYFGNMEEWCDGIAPNTFVDVDPGIRPDYVVIGEPTNMRVYRGHKGRLELEVVARGRSAHAASNQLGDNALYKLLPVIVGVRDMEPVLGDHDFLGHGKITVTDISVQSPSINAVPDEAKIIIDRRMTFGETREDVMREIEAIIPPDYRESVTVRALVYDDPSYTGFVFPVEKYFPAWLMSNEHVLARAGQATRALCGMANEPTGKWDFSTNGIYWAGKANIPSIGFGPGDEVTAHTVQDSVALGDVVKATEFYAALPGEIGALIGGDEK